MTVDYTQGNALDIFYGLLVDPIDLSQTYERVRIPSNLTLSWNAHTDEKRTGGFSAFGFPETGNRLLRIFCERHQGNDAATIPLGTYFMRRKDATYQRGLLLSGIELHSTLWRHINDRNYADYSFPAGDLAAVRMQALVSSGFGTLRIEPGVSDIPLKQPAYFKAGDERLAMINYCADYLGCESLDVDEDGILVARPYIPYQQRPVVWTFEDGRNCMYMDKHVISSNRDDIPTAFYVSCTAGDIQLTAIRRVPAESRYSALSRGRQQVAYYAHNDLSLVVGHAIVNRDCKLYASKDTTSTVLQDMSVRDDVTVVAQQADGDEWVQTRWNSTTGWTQAVNLSSQASVDAKADEYYDRGMSLAVSVEIEHMYAPVRPGQAVRFVRGSTGTDIVGIIHAQGLAAKRGIRTRTTIDVIGGELGALVDNPGSLIVAA